MTASRLVVLGRQGAGKGTQCARLAAELRIPHISTGDILRDAVRDETSVGLEAKSYMDAGDLVPDHVMVKIVHDRLLEADAVDGFLLDGFPRTAAQADALVLELGANQIDLAIDVDVPTEIVLGRLSSRRVCPGCHHVTSSPDPELNPIACPECGGDAYRRSDDNPESIARRLAVYDQQAAELQDWFDTRGLLRRVDGTQAPNDVYLAITMVIGSSEVVQAH